MNIYETIEKRRSVRKFRGEEVPEEKLKKILEAAKMAPSASNAQDYKFVVVKDKEKREEIMKAAAHQKFVAEAPLIIVPVSTNPEHIMGCGIPAYPIDIAIAIDHMTLAAVEEGLGTCWVGAFDQEKVKKILNIPEKYKAVVLLPLGTPYGEPSVKSRKNLLELVRYDEFSE